MRSFAAVASLASSAAGMRRVVAAVPLASSAAGMRRVVAAVSLAASAAAMRRFVTAVFVASTAAAPGTLCAIGAVLVAVVPAGAALPDAPVNVDVPNIVREGERVTLRVQLDPRARPASADEALEVHVVQLPLAIRGLRYLGPEDWRDVPAAYRTTLAALAARPMAATWEEAGPPGWTSLLVTFSAAGSGPGNRLAWRYAPRLITVYVKPRLPAPWPLTLAASLGSLAVIATTVVAWTALRPWPPAPERSPESPRD